MQSSKWEKACLIDNPFASNPSTLSEEIIWADMTKQKKQLEDRLRTALVTSPYSLTLNWGVWGSGKTHAAKYFSQSTVLKDLSTKEGVVPPLSLILTIPKGAKDIVRSIYLDILGKIGWQQIVSSLSQVANRLGTDFGRLLRDMKTDEEFALALSLLVGQILPREVDQQIRKNFNSEADFSLTLKRYFLLAATSSEVRKLGLGRSIENSNDMIQILATIFNLFLPSGSGIYSEIIIWFDEMEEIISLPGKQQAILTSLIRDLIDSIPKNLTLFINFTPRPGRRVEDLGVYLTPAVWDRVREQVIFENLSEEDMLNYVTDLLNSLKFRPDHLRALCPDNFFPFTKEALQLFGKMLGGNLTPRHINEGCSTLIEQALARGTLNEPNSRIGANFVQELRPEIQPLIDKGKISSR